MTVLTQRPAPFLGAPTSLRPEDVATPFAFLGIPFGPPYEPADLSVCAGAADAVRAVTHTAGYAANWSHYDFDTGRALFPNNVPTVTDLGDVPGDVRDPDAIWDEAVRTITPLASRGVVPLIVGGLDAIPPIVVEAFDGSGEINVLHVDAHLDYRDEVMGIRRGYSNHVRRIREYEYVRHVVQVGLRSMGSARPSDVDDALAAGNRIVTAWELHATGAESLLTSLPRENKWIITVDCDGLDPSIAPAVGWPEPGGLTYMQIATLLQGLARDDLIAAVVFTEFRPDLDVRETTARTVARLLINVIGHSRPSTFQ